MIDAFVFDGTVALVALAALAVELAVILVIVAKRRQLPGGHLVANLLSGVFLILALRSALLDQGSGRVALFLGLAGGAHLADVVMRLRDRTDRR